MTALAARSSSEFPESEGGTRSGSLRSVIIHNR